MKTCALIIITGLLFFFSGCGRDSAHYGMPDMAGRMEVWIYGIGRADAILLLTENHTLLIDTGENRHGRPIVSHMQSHGIRRVDYLIITHFDSDHVGGAHVVLNELDVGQVIVPDYSRESNHVNRFINAMNRAGLEAFVLTETKRLSFDGVDLMIYPSNLGYIAFADDGSAADRYGNPVASPPPDDDFSIVVRVSHGENHFLFTGDAVAGRLQQLLDNEEIMGIDYDFLKIPRHGRHNRRSAEFIRAVSPRYAVITGLHPDDADHYYPERPTDTRVVAALESVGAEMFFTMSTGVRIKSDGTDMVIQYKNDD